MRPTPERAAALGIEAYWFIVEPNPKQLDRIVKKVEEGRIAVQIDRCYPLSDAHKAFVEAENRARQGKTILVVVDRVQTDETWLCSPRKSASNVALQRAL
ncbi:MAG: zinc-binding dehydrogenase [Luteibacter jiangsuensis]